MASSSMADKRVSVLMSYIDRGRSGPEFLASQKRIDYGINVRRVSANLGENVAIDFNENVDS